MTNSKSLTTRAATLAIMLAVAALAQTNREPAPANLCDVFLSPAQYNHKAVTVEGLLSPSFHSLFLSSPECTKAAIDFATQAILPASWETLPHGKELRRYFHRGKSATVRLTGTFEADPQRYGPDGARFRFAISGIASVGAAPPGFHFSARRFTFSPYLMEDLGESARRTPAKTAKYVFGVSSRNGDMDNCVKAFQDEMTEQYGFYDRDIYRMEVEEKQIVAKGKEFVGFELLAI